MQVRSSTRRRRWPARAASRAAAACRLTLTAAVLVVTDAAAQDGAAAQRELETHQALWAAAALDDYEYGYNKYCECHRDDPPETLVTVRDGEVVRVRHRPVGYAREVEAEQRNLQWYWTVPGLFDLLHSALGREAVVRAEYDPTLGYPTRVYVDYDADLIGDEVDVRLTRLVPLAE